MDDILIENGSGQSTSWQLAISQTEESSSSILVLADTSSNFQILINYIQKAFPKVKSSLSRKLLDNDSAVSSPRLVLVDAYTFRSVTTLISQCQELYPAAAIGVMVDIGWYKDPGLRAILSERKIRGIVSFDVPLNVWLATVWLLLNGGEYFPSAPTPRSAARSFLSCRGIGKSDGPYADCEGVLTSCEAEILELMSDGLQDKTIASKLRLSEYKVKAHVQLITRKLNVRNRTEALAIFRSLERRPTLAAPAVRALPLRDIMFHVRI